jgi:hypothetical protein
LEYSYRNELLYVEYKNGKLIGKGKAKPDAKIWGPLGAQVGNKLSYGFRDI